jgi:aryl-alcohol dehydrogenase-like predicted oxidoreductase
VEQIRAAEAAARASGGTRFVAVQNEYSLLVRQDESSVLPLCRELRLGYVPFFPLANGLLTGKFRRGAAIPQGTRLAARPEYVTEEKLELIDSLVAFAAERGRTLLELAIGALATQPGVASVIAGATSAEQVRANAAAGDWELTSAELAAIPSLLRKTGIRSRGSRSREDP